MTDKDTQSINNIIKAFEREIELQKKDEKMGLKSIASDLFDALINFAEMFDLERCFYCHEFKEDVSGREVGDRCCEDCWDRHLDSEAQLEADMNDYKCNGSR